MARCYGIECEFMNDGRGSTTHLNTGSLKIDPTIIYLYPPRPLEVSLGDQPSMDEMTEVINGMPNWSGQTASRLNY